MLERPMIAQCRPLIDFDDSRQTVHRSQLTFEQIVPNSMILYYKYHTLLSPYNSLKKHQHIYSTVTDFAKFLG